MEHIRWYDKDKNMKLLLNMLEKLPEEARNNIAEEIIQLLTQKNISTDKFIGELEYIPDRSRWYDSSETLHSAIKMLKKLEQTQRKDVFVEIFSSVFETIQNYKNSH